YFFQDIIKKQSLVSFFDFQNKKRIFPDVWPKIKFCLLTLAANPQPQALFSAQLDDPALLEDSGRQYTLTPKEIQKINPNTLNCPAFSTARDAELIKDIHNRMPIFIEEGVRGQSQIRNPWNI